MATIFTNLRLVEKDNETVCAELLVENGIFADLREPSKRRQVKRTSVPLVDLENRLVLPGVIDGHVHFDEPGFECRETFLSGTRAAAAGGVTLVADMPCTSIPPVTMKSSLEHKLSIISPKAHVDFMCWGGVCANGMEEGDWREDFRDLALAGVPAFKVYLTSGMETFRDLSIEQVGEVLKEVKNYGLPVGVHAEDRDFVQSETKRLLAGSRRSLEDYAVSRGTEAEERAIRQLVEINSKIGAKVHIVHLSSAKGLELVKKAKKSGQAFSAETCPHYLAFTADDLFKMGSILKTAPAVKYAVDREALWYGLASGDLDFVTTDHAAGKWPEEKNTGDAWLDYGGIPGVELSLPYLLSEGVNKGRITLQRLQEVTSRNPATFLGVSSIKGRIAPGFEADFAVLDEGCEWLVKAENLHNLNRYTPFAGQLFKGRVMATYLRGQCIYGFKEGPEMFPQRPCGRFVKRVEKNVKSAH